MCKRRVGVIFGGRSEEHQVSCNSAAYAMRALDADKYDPVYIGITKEGDWRLFEGPISAVTEGDWFRYTEEFSIDNLKKRVDFVLPLLHGPYGEDGTLQGLLELMDIPYGGCGVSASALAMDKDFFKEIMTAHGLPLCQSLVFKRNQIEKDYNYIESQISSRLGYPCFIKPANMGSSVGISKVSQKDFLRSALNTALCYDEKIIAEEFINAREIEVAVMGNYIIEASCPGEIIAIGDFYDYESKYSGTSGLSQLIIPAKIDKETCNRLKHLAKEAFNAIGGQGFARVDFFQSKDDGNIYINEINTIPGMTKQSMFPLLWQAEGKTPGQIIERIIDLGYERYYSKNCRKTAV